MTTVTDDIAAALPNAVAELGRVVRAVPAPTRSVPSTPGWTVADVVTHLAVETDRYRRELEGDSDWADDPRDIARVNRDALVQNGDRDIEANLRRVRDNVERYVEALRNRDLDEPSHHLDGGLLLTPRQGAGVLLGELAVHRWDIAKATGQRATISRQEALLILDGILHTLPAMVDREAARDHVGTYEIRVRRAGSYSIRIERGTASVTPNRTERPDAVMSVDPVGFVLASYGRQGPIRTALRLQAFVWGRRPHRAFAMDGLFVRI